MTMWFLKLTDINCANIGGYVCVLTTSPHRELNLIVLLIQKPPKLHGDQMNGVVVYEGQTDKHLFLYMRLHLYLIILLL